MTPDAYTFELLHTGYASVRSATCVFIRFRPDQPWEFYTVASTGDWKGIERFYRYLTPDEGARLSAVFNAHA